MIFQATLACDRRAAHGECSWWDAKKQRLIWLDCMGAAINLHYPAENRNEHVSLGFNPMTVIPNEPGGYIAASEDTVMLLNDDFSVAKTLCTVDLGVADARFNDGKCGPDGRLYIGSMGQHDEPDAGKLYRIDFDGSAHIVLDNCAISNGLAWTKDGKHLVYTDSCDGELDIYDFDAGSGTLSNKRVFYKTKLMPDGLCLDADDNTWTACWGSARVICVETATGRLLHETKAGAPNTSSTVFGGENMRTLFITTSRLGLSEAELEKYPSSGGLYAAKTSVTGAEMHRGKYTL